MAPGTPGPSTSLCYEVDVMGSQMRRVHAGQHGHVRNSDVHAFSIRGHVLNCCPAVVKDFQVGDDRVALKVIISNYDPKNGSWRWMVG